MTEKELIGKIRELRQIKPRKDWASLTKSQILGEEPKRSLAPFWGIFPRLVFQPKPVFATLIILGVLIGTFGFAQNSLPGDFLYPLKKITEKSQAVFVSEKELPKYNLEIANKRLEELNKIAQTNQVKKLASAINEVQASVSEAAKNLVELKQVDKKIVEKAIQIGKNTKKTEEVLATKIFLEETEESLNDFYKAQAQMLIKDLETRTLTEEKEEILTQMKKLFEEEKYSEALELYFISQ